MAYCELEKFLRGNDITLSKTPILVLAQEKDMSETIRDIKGLLFECNDIRSVAIRNEFGGQSRKERAEFLKNFEYKSFDALILPVVIPNSMLCYTLWDILTLVSNVLALQISEEPEDVTGVLAVSNLLQWQSDYKNSDFANYWTIDGMNFEGERYDAEQPNLNISVEEYLKNYTIDISKSNLDKNKIINYLNTRLIYMQYTLTNVSTTREYEEITFGMTVLTTLRELIIKGSFDLKTKQRG